MRWAITHTYPPQESRTTLGAAHRSRVMASREGEDGDGDARLKALEAAFAVAKGGMGQRPGAGRRGRCPLASGVADASDRSATRIAGGACESAGAIGRKGSRALRRDGWMGCGVIGYFVQTSIYVACRSRIRYRHRGSATVLRGIHAARARNAQRNAANPSSRRGACSRRREEY